MLSKRHCFIISVYTIFTLHTPGFCDGPLTYFYGGFTHINSLAIDHDGIIWVGAYNIFSFNGIKWTQYENTYAEALFVDSYNNKWAAISGYPPHLLKYDGIEWSFIPLRDEAMDVSTVTALAINNDEIWLAMNHSPYEFDEKYWLEHYDGSTWKSYTTNDGIVSNYVLCIVIDKDENVWFGTDKGVSRFNGASWTTFTTEDGLLDNFVDSLFSDSKRYLWFNANGNSWEKTGISRYNGTSWTYYIVDYPDDCVNCHSSVNCFAEDVEGNIWFGHNNGLAKFDGTRIIDMKELYWDFPEDIVNEIVIDHNNIKWLGTDDHGLVRFDDSLLSVEIEQKPHILTLLPNSPNPFNPSTTITFSLPSNGFTSLIIYNMMGQKIRNLLMETMQAGTHSIIWDGKDENGIPVSSGIYFSKLLQGNHSANGKMMVVR